MLDQCPECGYSLRGLPADHRCPECGLPYDAESEAFRLVNPKAIYVGMIGLAGGAIPMINMVFSLGAALTRRYLVFLIALAYVGLIGGVFVYLRMLMRSRPQVAVLPRGLFVRLKRLKPEWYSWSDISNVLLNRAFKKQAVTVLFKDGRPILDLVGFFHCADDAIRMVDNVRRRLRDTVVRPSDS